ncbi:MAG TPA: penicillin-binding protein 2, partial [Verrucomicrobiae bacterium]
SWHRWRVGGLSLLLGSAFAGLGYRLVDLQVLQHDALKAQAQNNTQRRYLMEPKRGDILDARGNPLAMSVPVKRVCADPALIGAHQGEVAKALAPLLQWDEGKLCQALQIKTHLNTNTHQLVTNRFVDLKRKVNVETWQQITQGLANLKFVEDEKKIPPRERNFYRDLRRKSIYAVDDYHRIYPSRSLAAHVLGFVGMDETVMNERPASQTTGKDGIEAALNSKLCGTRGWRVTERDHKNREIVELRLEDVEARPGLNAVLTIDMVLQHIVETELAETMKKHTPISASGIIVRPRTGEILALATLPNYDPNDPGAFDNDSRRNRVISDLAEPGSTFKIVVVSGALAEGVVRLTDSLDCENGHFLYCGRTLHDHEAYGILTVEQIITKSSNIGAAKIGIRLGEPLLHHYIRNFGFGTRTGIPLGGEVNGIVHPLKDWTKLSVSRIPMGHEVAVTPLQMVMAMSALANHGKLMRPMLIHRLQNQDGEVFAQYAPQPVRQIISEAAAHQMVEALKTVVTKDGTAFKAALDHYTVAGKTGTAQKVVNGQYVTGKYFSSFIGFFPADAPELCISVVLDEPKNGHYGGQTAAPIFKSIAEQAAKYLNIRPDRLDPDAESMAVIIDANSPPKTLTQRAP